MPKMSTSAFFSDSQSVLQRSTEVKVQVPVSQNVEDQYEVDRCANFISSHKFLKVALQFPDELLGISACLASCLEVRTGATICILGDTSYGSCCVDEVAAQHGGAEAIIHYGPACLSPTRRIPVLYVFGRGLLDIEACCASFRSLLPHHAERILVISDVMYSHALNEIEARLQGDYANTVFSKIEMVENIPPKDIGPSAPEASGDSLSGIPCECNSGGCCSKGQSKKQSQESQERPALTSESAETADNERTRDGDETQIGSRDIKADLFFGRKLNLEEGSSVDDYTVFYIGSESRTLTNFMMNLNKCAFFTFDPIATEGRHETLNVSRALMKRYHLIERAKDASIVGIVAGTLGVANYLGVIAHLKRLLRHAGKKCYTFAVGKLNVPKLANFMEVDVYVLVACPENSLIDSKEFYRPVVTPFEMEIACNQAREWTGEYITDFNRLIPGASAYVEIPTSPSTSSARTDVSLISGKLRSVGLREGEDETNDQSSTVVKRDATMTISQVHRNASEFLAARSWQGLEQDLGQTEVTMATEGRKGIAASYSHEDH